MSEIALNIDAQRFEEIKGLLSHIEDGVEFAILRALNRGMEKIRTDAVRYVCERYTIEPAQVRKRIHIIRATRKHLTAKIIFSSPRVAVAFFKRSPKTPPRQKGIPVAQRKKIKTEIIEGHPVEWSQGFLIRMQTGRVGLFTRMKGSRDIRERYSLSIAQMAGHEEVLQNYLQAGMKRLEEVLNQQVKFMLETGQTGAHKKKHHK